MQVIDGKLTAMKWRANIMAEVEQLAPTGTIPGLAVVLVGDDPASVIYTNMKERASQALGFKSIKKTLPASTTTDEVITEIKLLNEDSEVHGILVQLPLPQQINTDHVISSIDPAKDVDGLHPNSLGRILIGHEEIVPATPRGIMQLIKDYKIETAGRHVVIVGRSNILGKPLAAMFLNRDATVTICHSKTKNLADLTRQGDIVVMDTGVPGLLTGEMVKDQAVVIDAGITKLPDGKVVGDAQFDELTNKVSAITPVPGGVGPMTIAALLQNTVDLAKLAARD